MLAPTLHGLRVGNLLEAFIIYLIDNKVIAYDETLVYSSNFIGKYHDIGKACVSSALLNKPGTLNPEEFAEIRRHVQYGIELLELHKDYFMDLVSVETYTILEECLSTHHERWDGYGYPESLKGNNIPLIGRICCIVDSFDVMTHNRSYKSAFSKQESLEEILRCSKTQFDPILAKAFVEFCNHTGL